MHPPGAKRILAISGSLRSGSSNHAILLFLGKIALLAKADGIIICTPEYAYGVPGSLKNALDWTISSGSLVDKPVALITASTGGENTHAAMLLILGALSANLLKDATLLVPFIRSKID